MKMISIKEKLPSNGKYRLVMVEDGLHICSYSTKNDTWVDRDYYHYGDVVTHWQPLPDETNCVSQQRELLKAFQNHYQSDNFDDEMSFDWNISNFLKAFNCD